MFDLVIVGGGPAGVGAAVYAARKKLKTLFITDGWGGQSVVSADIQNWIGTKSISGLDFAKNFEEHVRSYGADVEIWDTDLVVKVEKKDGHFFLTTKSGKTLEARTVLVTSGSRRRRLGIPGEDKLDGKGIVWCSTCDAPLFKNMEVAIIGGGNAGLETVLDLNSYAKKIYLLHRGPALKGDPITQEKISKIEKVTIILNAQIEEILGDKFVSGVKYNGIILPVQGVFIEIGSVPNTEFLGGLVNLNEKGEIIVDHKTQQSSLEGIWSAGDISDVLYKQNNISVGDAVKAVLNIYSYLHKEGHI